MAFVRYKKQGSKWYAFEVSNQWDKESKKYKQHSRYLGVANEKGGEYKKARASSDQYSVIDFGDGFVLSHILQEIGLADIVKDVFGEPENILSLVCYQLVQRQ